MSDSHLIDHDSSITLSFSLFMKLPIRCCFSSINRTSVVAMSDFEVFTSEHARFDA